MAEIEAAAEAYEEFAIQVDTDNIKATDYFVDLTNYDSGFIKMNPIISHFRVVLGKDYFDRIYVVELEVSAKRDFVYYVNWGIIIGSVFIYAIYSTVKLVKYRKRLRQAG